MSDYKFGTKIQNSDNKVDRVYFMIFYNEKENAKKLGYKWDKEKRSWYKDLIYSKELKIHYEVNKNHNEKDIYDKYNDIYYRTIEENVFSKSEKVNESKARDILYSC